MLFGVTFISFLFLVYFAPDQTYNLLGKNPTAEDIQNIRRQLGLDQSIWLRYYKFLLEMLQFDFRCIRNEQC